MIVRPWPHQAKEAGHEKPLIGEGFPLPVGLKELTSDSARSAALALDLVAVVSRGRAVAEQDRFHALSVLRLGPAPESISIPCATERSHEPHPREPTLPSAQGMFDLVKEWPLGHALRPG